jgi:hypothetical protein
MKTELKTLATAAVWTGVCLLTPPAGRAHGDAMDGPVVAAAKGALDQGDVTPTFKWIKKEREAEVREAFQKTLAVRKLGPQARELADQSFFETLVRIHRAGTSAPDTGLKPSGATVEAAAAQADEALNSGSVKSLAQSLANAVADGVRQRFARAHAAKENADSSADAGRRYVEAYVEFIHYVERVAHTAKPPAADHKH